MNKEPEDSLERFIDHELKRVPNFKAPSGFAGRVMQATVNSNEMWWQNSWIHWPLGAKLVSLVLFTALAWASMHEFISLAMGVSVSAQPLVNYVSRIVQNGLSVAGDVWGWLRPFQNQWLFVSLLAFAMTTSFAIGVGHALWPLLRRKE